MRLSKNFVVGKLLYYIIINLLIDIGKSVGSLSLSLTSPTINSNSIYQF